MRWTILAGILGGIAMYVWSAVAHVATPLGEVGINSLPNEGMTIETIAADMGRHSGMFLFPDMRPGKPMANKKGTGPGGLLVYQPNASMGMNPVTLGKEFAKEVLTSIIAALLLSWSVLEGYGARVGFVSLIGLAATLTTNVSYWAWYNFPGRYTAANMAIEFVGFVVAGLVIAALVPKPQS